MDVYEFIVFILVLIKIGDVATAIENFVFLYKRKGNKEGWL